MYNLKIKLLYNLKIWIGLFNFTKSACKARIAKFYKHYTNHFSRQWGTNPPPHTQHSEGVGGCSKDSLNVVVRRLGADRGEDNFQHTHSHLGPMSLKSG